MALEELAHFPVATYFPGPFPYFLPDISLFGVRRFIHYHNILPIFTHFQACSAQAVSTSNTIPSSHSQHPSRAERSLVRSTADRKISRQPVKPVPPQQPWTSRVMPLTHIFRSTSPKPRGMPTPVVRLWRINVSTSRVPISNLTNGMTEAPKLGRRRKSTERALAKTAEQ